VQIKQLKYHSLLNQVLQSVILSYSTLLLEKMI